MATQWDCSQCLLRNQHAAGSATSSLVIVSPGRKDVGWYSCIASTVTVRCRRPRTSSGICGDLIVLVTSEALSGQTVTLRCLVTSFPPDLITPAPPVIQKVNTTFVTVGNTLQLTCTADSVHLPSYSWRSGNQSITNTSRVTVSVVEVGVVSCW
eukprot:Em0006g612a